MCEEQCKPPPPLAKCNKETKTCEEGCKRGDEVRKTPVLMTFLLMKASLSRQAQDELKEVLQKTLVFFAGLHRCRRMRRPVQATPTSHTTNTTNTANTAYTSSTADASNTTTGRPNHPHDDSWSLARHWYPERLHVR